MYKLTDNNSVIRLTDGTFIPRAEGNRDYQEYKTWLEAGNTPQPADTDVIVGEIGTTNWKTQKSSYALANGEVLMTTPPPSTNAYAKEDGTWLVPAQEYFIYHNVDNKCVIDRNASYAAVEESYRGQYANLLLAMSSCPYALKAGTITQEQYDTNMSEMEAERLEIIQEMATKKGLVDNG